MTLYQGGSIGNSSSIIVADGAIFDVSAKTGGFTLTNGQSLSGGGTVSGGVVIANGGTLAVGNSIGSLATGALSLEAASTFAYEMDNDAAAGVAGDLTAVTGDLSLFAGALLTLTELGAGSWTDGDKLTLISYDGTWSGGLFDYQSASLADDSTFSFSGTDWDINYNDTDAGTNYTSTGLNYVTITAAAVPEPSTIALLGLGGLALVLRRRRR